MLKNILLLSFTITLFAATGNSQPNAQSGLKYSVNNPDFKVALPDVLKEVSGIVWIDAQTLACVQDENGTIYTYDLQQKTITNSYEFSNEGDYEGITVAGDVLYVLRSDGVLFEVTNYASDEKVENFYSLNIPTPNSEGICYDKKNNHLLIVSKGKPADLDEKSAKNLRYIYRFNLKTKMLFHEPIRINLSDIEKFIETNHIYIPPVIEKDGDKKERKLKLRSSEIAVHPQTQDFYVLSAKESMMYIFDRTGRILNVIPLNEDLFPKAEGITFSPEGKMYISNEANDGPPTLLYIYPR